MKDIHRIRINDLLSLRFATDCHAPSIAGIAVGHHRSCPRCVLVARNDSASQRQCLLPHILACLAIKGRRVAHRHGIDHGLAKRPETARCWDQSRRGGTFSQKIFSICQRKADLAGQST
jgi:hypothetical protein